MKESYRASNERTNEFGIRMAEIDRQLTVDGERRKNNSDANVIRTLLLKFKLFILNVYGESRPRVS